MSAGPHKALADQVFETIQGGTIASKLLDDIRGGHAAPDALLEAVQAAGEGERLRGLARTLQKALERA